MTYEFLVRLFFSALGLAFCIHGLRGVRTQRINPLGDESPLPLQGRAAVRAGYFEMLLGFFTLILALFIHIGS